MAKSFLVLCLVAALLSGFQPAANAAKNPCPTGKNKKVQGGCACGFLADSPKCAGGLTCQPVTPPLPPTTPGGAPVYGKCIATKCTKIPRRASCTCGGKAGKCQDNLECFRKLSKPNTGSNQKTIIGQCCDPNALFSSQGCHCGGIMNPKRCMPGLMCKVYSNNMDFGGICVRIK